MGAPTIEQLDRLDEALAERGQAVFDAGGHDFEYYACNQPTLLQFTQGLGHHLFRQAGDVALERAGPGAAPHQMDGVQDHGDPFAGEEAQKAAWRAIFGERGLFQSFRQSGQVRRRDYGMIGVVFGRQDAIGHHGSLLVPRAQNSAGLSFLSGYGQLHQHN